MNLATYVKCLKRHALNKKISDEEFLNAVLKPYIEAGEIDNKNNEELHLDKSRTSLILNRHEDVPGALRRSLNNENMYPWAEENYKDFINDYMNPAEMQAVIDEITEMIEEDESIPDKHSFIELKDEANLLLSHVLIECIKLKNDGFNPEGDIIRNGSYCVKAVYKDILSYGFRKRSKRKNIVVIPVDTGFRTHVTRKYENSKMSEVSANSIHGQFLTRWEQSGEDIDSLSQRIRNGLQVEADQKGEYPLGTIAVIERNTTIFYLLAISSFDENNNAHASKETIIFCVDELSKFYDKYGDGYNLYIPLMGTGKSRANISLQESYDILIDCYKRNKARIQGNIHIVIQKDFEKCINTNEGGD
ncbi:MAG: hypothetical protein HUJ58_00490 [Erysipelotrichaceae bacterium]|nr:hypothetical protein [Erysipelotrichaceae bacterium]